jgi:hypothetical protein
MLTTPSSQVRFARMDDSAVSASGMPVPNAVSIVNARCQCRRASPFWPSAR